MSVPSRNSSGRCLECRTYRLPSAPRNCVRCGLEEAAAMGKPVYNMTEMNTSVMENLERWSLVARHFTDGWIAPERFYVYVAVGNSRLGLAIGQQGGAAHQTFHSAVRQARQLSPVYETIWIITHQGAIEMYEIDVY